MDKSAGQNGGFGTGDSAFGGASVSEMETFDRVDLSGSGNFDSVVKNTETEVNQGLENVSTEMVPRNMLTRNVAPERKTLDSAMSGDIVRGFGGNVVNVIKNTGAEVGILNAGAEVTRSGVELRAAERELRRDEQEIMFPERSVGEETPMLTESRIEEDLNDLRNEENIAPKGASAAEAALIERDHKIVQRFLNEKAAEVASEVGRIMNQPVVHPGEIAALRQREMGETLRGAFSFSFGNDN